MSQVYTPTATAHGSYTLPSDGDPAVAESVNDALRDLADGVLRANNQADTAVTLAGQMINGVTGGTYTPSGNIIINGPGDLVIGGTSGLNLNGTALSIFSNATLEVDGESTFTGDSLFTGDVNATGTVSLSGTTSAADLTAALFSVTGDSSFGDSAADTFTCAATAVFQEAVTLEGTARFEDSVDFRNTVTFRHNVQLGTSSADGINVGGTMTLTQPLQYSDVGRVPYRAPVSLPTGGATVTVEDGDVFIVPTTATGNYTASETGAQDGDRMRFFSTGNMSSSRTIVAGSATHTFSAGNTTFSELIYDETFGGWRLALFTSF